MSSVGGMPPAIGIALRAILHSKIRMSSVGGMPPASGIALRAILHSEICISCVGGMPPAIGTALRAILHSGTAPNRLAKVRSAGFLLNSTPPPDFHGAAPAL